MSVSVYSVFVLPCVQVRWADPPSKESYRMCKKIEKLNSGQGPTEGCRATVEYIYYIYTLTKLQHNSF
jgi:hypothetical protein